MTDKTKPEQKTDVLRMESTSAIQQEYIGRLTHELLVSRTDTLVLKTKLADALDIIKIKEDLVGVLQENTDKLKGELEKKTSQLASNVFKHERMLNIHRIAGSIMPEFCRSGAKAFNADWLNPWDVSAITGNRVRAYLKASTAKEASDALRFILKTLRINTEGSFKHILNRESLDKTPYANEHVLYQVLCNHIAACDSEVQEKEKQKQEQA